MVNGFEMMNVKTAVGLSDPVCDKQHFRTMAEAFIREHPKAMFVQVTAGQIVGPNCWARPWTRQFEGPDS